MAADEAQVDVETLMRQVRARIAQRRAGQGLSAEEIERRVAARLAAYGERAQIDPRLARLLLAPDQPWNIAPDYLPRSHRPGLAGWLSRTAKRIVRPCVRLYTDHLTSRQAQINLYLHAFLFDAVAEIEALRGDVQALEARLEKLERRAEP
ncbi:MAG: hypothetical protein MUF51_00540 [Vicinamibacteria bacterium]|jgi:hypothetical protein|nr:hypothetical protein [Vicinamibacteria bacterium]